jgi:hypothetical protein
MPVASRPAAIEGPPDQVQWPQRVFLWNRKSRASLENLCGPGWHVRDLDQLSVGIDIGLVVHRIADAVGIDEPDSALQAQGTCHLSPPCTIPLKGGRRICRYRALRPLAPLQAGPAQGSLSSAASPFPAPEPRNDRGHNHR